MSDPTVCPTCSEKVFQEDDHGCPTVQLKDVSENYTLRVTNHGLTGDCRKILNPVKVLDSNKINQAVEYLTGAASATWDITPNGIPVPPFLPNTTSGYSITRDKQPSSTCPHCWCVEDLSSELRLSGTHYFGIKPHQVCCACTARRLAE